MAEIPTINTEDPSVARHIRQKEKLKQKLSTTSSISSTSSSSQRPTRIPKGNHKVKEWVVFDLGLRPPTSYFEEEWKLEIVCGKDTYTLSQLDLDNLPIRKLCSDWHCVTGWSATDLQLEGILMKDLLSYPPISRLISSNVPHWKWLYCESADGYTVPIFRQDLVLEGDNELNDTTSALLLLSQGEPLSADHGGPCRLLLPTLFGWKSGKWVVRWTFLNEYKAGFWERLGCHQRGRHICNERFDTQAEGIWKCLIAAPFAYRRVFGDRVWILVMQFGGNLLGKIVSYFFSFLHRAPPALHDKSESKDKKRA